MNNDHTFSKKQKVPKRAGTSARKVVDESTRQEGAPTEAEWNTMSKAGGSFVGEQVVHIMHT